MSIVLDYAELDDFGKTCLKVAAERFPRETSNFIQRAGNKLKAEIAANEKAALKYRSGKKTGNLLAGLSRGRASIYGGNSYQVRVRFKQPAYHAYLVEHGHELWSHPYNAKRARYTGRFVQGNHVVGKTANMFKGTFANMAAKFAVELVEGGFK